MVLFVALFLVCGGLGDGDGDGWMGGMTVWYEHGRFWVDEERRSTYIPSLFQKQNQRLRQVSGISTIWPSRSPGMHHIELGQENDVS